MSGLQSEVNDLRLSNTHLMARITALESAAQAMVEWSYNNFDIDHCEPFDDLRAALLGVQK